MAKSPGKRFAIGVDFGTNSVRALVVDVADGAEIATHVYDYPTGEDGILLDLKDPNLARQNPADYIQGFYQSVRGALGAAKRVRGFRAENVIGIGVDTTGSTPMPVDRQGMPLAMKPQFKRNLAAQAWQFLQDLVYEHGIAPQGQTDYATDFLAGRTAMLIDGPWRMPALEAAEEETDAGEEEGAERLAGQKEQLKRLMELKSRIITAVNTARPPLEKSRIQHSRGSTSTPALGFRGAGFSKGDYKSRLS